LQEKLPRVTAPWLSLQFRGDLIAILVRQEQAQG